jgi:hypothetical protein
MLIYHIIFAIIGWSAFIYSFFADYNHLVNFFSYFTIQSNLLVICWFTLSIWKDKFSFTRSPIIRGGLLVYITVTMIIFFTLLFKEYVGLSLVTTYVLHLILPLSFIVDWFLDKPRERIKLKSALGWIIYPTIYCLYTIIREMLVGWYPYYFLSPIRMHSYINVGIAITGLTVFFLVITLIVYKLNNKFSEGKPIEIS